VIVLDASATVDMLVGTPAGTRVAQRVMADGARAHAPHLLDVEVTSALRRGVRRRVLDAVRAAEALADFASLSLVRHPHGPLLPRMWALRDTVSAYDAAYVALAEELGATLLTLDARLARAGDHRAKVEVIAN
jgi:predicted nucleic acid-binding protein